jgi:hypothetical protein
LRNHKSFFTAVCGFDQDTYGVNQNKKVLPRKKINPENIPKKISARAHSRELLYAVKSVNKFSGIRSVSLEALTTLAGDLFFPQIRLASSYEIRSFWWQIAPGGGH